MDDSRRRLLNTTFVNCIPKMLIAGLIRSYTVDGSPTWNAVGHRLGPADFSASNAYRVVILNVPTDLIHLL